MLDVDESAAPAALQAVRDSAGDDSKVSFMQVGLMAHIQLLMATAGDMSTV